MSSQLQNKLLHYEVQPPGEVWDKITASLDEQISPVLAQKLYQYEKEPPSGIWKNIVAQLDPPVSEKAKVVPFYVRYRRPLKYSGAVAIFIFLAILTSLLIGNKTRSELPAENRANNSGTKKDTAATPAEQVNSSLAAISRNKQEPLSAKSKAPKVKRETTQPQFSFDENLLPRQAERNVFVSSSLSPDKYMIYSDRDGNAIRLPKKIFSAFACPSDDFICKQRLQQLREKFAASAMTADFNGLLQILKSLQENQ